MKTQKHRFLQPLALAALLISPAAMAQQYELVDLSGLLGGETILTGVNDHGVVCGFAGAWPSGQAFRWQGGAVTALNGLPGHSFTRALDVNRNGDVVGYSQASTGLSFAVLWPAGSTQPIDLGNLAEPTGGFAVASGIGNSGHIVGFSQTASSQIHGFRSVNGVMEDLPSLGSGVYAGSWAEAVNASGIVAGSTNFGGLSQEQAAWWDASGAIHGLPGLGGSAAKALNINDSGIMAGWATDAAFERFPCTWAQGALQLLPLPTGFLEGEARDLNALGQIAGYAEGGPINGQDRALLWENGVVKELNALVGFIPGWNLTEATGINDRGWIIGQAFHAGVPSAFLLRPSLALSTPLPGIAGTTNQFPVTGATPGNTVYLCYGFLLGFTPVPGCADLYVGIQQPVVPSPMAADALGNAIFQQFVPSVASGLLVYLHAVEPSSCRSSDLIAHTF